MRSQILRHWDSRQGAVGVGALAFEELRGAPDAGKWVLDFMREHGGKRGHRAGGAAMRELAFDHLRHAALLQHDQHLAGHLGDRPTIEIDEFRRLETDGAELDAVGVILEDNPDGTRWLRR